jgi:hypothetical protein
MGEGVGELERRIILKKWERERESEKEGELKKKNRRGRRRIRERRRIKKKKTGGGRGTVGEREKKKFPCCFGIHQSLCHMEWGKEREGKKYVPAFHFEES